MDVGTSSWESLCSVPRLIQRGWRSLSLLVLRFAQVGTVDRFQVIKHTVHAFCDRFEGDGSEPESQVSSALGEALT